MWPWKRKAESARARDKPQTGHRQPRNLRNVQRPRADVTMQGNEAVYAAVSRIANTIAALPLHLYKGFEPQPNHPLEKLVSLAPNENFSAFNFKQTMEVYRNTEGSAYALIVRDRLGAVDRLEILNPTRVVPKRDPVSNEVWYQITMDDGAQMYLPGFAVISIRHMSANGERGIRPIDVLRRSLDYDTQVRQLSLEQLDGVNHGLMLTVPNSGLGQEEKDELVDRFLETYEKSGRTVVILEGGLTATNFEAKAVDAQLLDVERITRNRVATVYNLPPHMLGDYSDTSFGTAEQQMQEYLQLTILPIAQQWEEEFDRKLLTSEEYAQGYRFRFDLTQLTRADTATMSNRYQMAIRGGWMKPNEVRAAENLPPDPNGDELMSSRDLLPLHVAVQNPELLLAPQLIQPKEGTEDGDDK